MGCFLWQKFIPVEKLLLESNPRTLLEWIHERKLIVYDFWRERTRCNYFYIYLKVSWFNKKKEKNNSLYLVLNCYSVFFRSRVKNRKSCLDHEPVIIAKNPWNEDWDLDHGNITIATQPAFPRWTWRRKVSFRELENKNREHNLKIRKHDEDC